VIAVDSSVWIAHFRNAGSESVGVLRSLFGATDLLVGDIVLLEVLQGARDDAHAVRIAHELNQFSMVGMLDADIAVQAARNYRVLRGKGVTPRKTVDLIIGTFCIEHGYTLLHDDRDFEPMRTHLGLLVL
jgi:predicted nucleic acid-binding protein